MLVADCHIFPLVFWVRLGEIVWKSWNLFDHPSNNSRPFHATRYGRVPGFFRIDVNVEGNAFRSIFRTHWAWSVYGAILSQTKQDSRLFFGWVRWLCQPWWERIRNHMLVRDSVLIWSYMFQTIFCSNYAEDVLHLQHSFYECTC